MKKVLLKSVLVFIGVLVVVSLAGFLLGFWVMVSEKKCEAPCDGAAMAAGFIWIFGFEAGIVLAFIAATTTAIYLRLKH